MESERLTTSDRTLVPNRYIVHLNPDDLADFGEMSPVLASELADGALAFARNHRYTVADRPQVDLVADPRIDRTDIHVHARFAEAVVGRPGHGPVVLEPQAVDGDVNGDPSVTRVFTIPRPTAPRAVIRVMDPDGQTRQAVVGPAGLTIGRASDNDVVIRDTRVSRHHGRIAGRRGTLVYADLGSTNGSRMNGVPVTEVVLGVGDRLEVGGAVLVVEVAGASA